MSYRVAAASAAAAVLGLYAWRRGVSRRTDGAWAVLRLCDGCGQLLPRWFFLDKGTARGPYSLYRYPIPARCRVCRHEKGFIPLPWEAGESEAVYSARMEKTARSRVASFTKDAEAPEKDSRRE